MQGAYENEVLKPAEFSELTRSPLRAMSMSMDMTSQVQCIFNAIGVPCVLSSSVELQTSAATSFLGGFCASGRSASSTGVPSRSPAARRGARGSHSSPPP